MTIALHPFLPFLIIALTAARSLVAASSPAGDNPGDRQALLDLYNATAGAGWTASGNWTRADVSMCDWFGVSCSCLLVSAAPAASAASATSCRVTSLVLPANRLVGTIPASIGALTALTSLDIGRNSGADGAVSGTVPPELGACTQLVSLRLGINAMSGTLPDSLGALHQLEELDLCANAFAGTLPAAVLTGMGALQIMGMSDNAFSGVFPAWLGTFAPALQHMFIANNQLRGPLPASLGLLSSLRTLDVCGISIGGSMPELIANLSSLRGLSLSGTGLGGSLPPWLGRLTQLDTLVLSLNNLTGPLPAEWAALTRLQLLDLSSNELGGSLPAAWSAVAPSLVSVDMSLNALSGELPAFLANASALLVLKMSDNSFGGTIPAAWSALAPTLLDLRVSNNQLVGELPPSWLGASSALVLLDVSENRLSGQPLAALDSAAAPQLSKLSLHTNRFSGPISSNIGALTRLEYLFAHTNQFNASLPGAALAALGALKILHLHANAFDGALPRSMPAALTSLKLNGNRLASSIPDEWAQKQQLTALEELDLGDNDLVGSLPPAVFAALPLLRFLDVSHNRFGGELPASLGSLGALQQLHADGNSFVGGIPLSFGGDAAGRASPLSASLRELTLSDNRLAGDGFPAVLRSMHALATLDLSRNAFRGACNVLSPSEPQFSPSVVNVSFNLFDSPLARADIGDFRADVFALDLSGNSFPCPYPIVPLASVALLVRSPCVPQWAPVAVAIASVIGALLLAGALYACVTKVSPAFVRGTRVRTFIFVAQWCVTVAAFALDAAALVDMIRRLRSRTDNCRALNEHVVFSSYMPATIAAQEEAAFATPTLSFAAWWAANRAFRLNTTLTFPVAARQSVFYITDFSQEALSSPTLAASNLAAFATLCRSVPSCDLQSHSSHGLPLQCVVARPDEQEFGSSTARAFLTVVYGIAAVRLLVELARTAVLIAAWIRISNGDADGQEWPDEARSADFASTAVLAPVLLLCGGEACRSAFHARVVLRDATHVDLLRRLVHTAALQTAPMSAANLIYLSSIVQTGLSNAGWASLAFGCAQLPLILGRAYRAWRRADPSLTSNELDSMLPAAHGSGGKMSVSSSPMPYHPL